MTTLTDAAFGVKTGAVLGLNEFVFESDAFNELKSAKGLSVVFGERVPVGFDSMAGLSILSVFLNVEAIVAFSLTGDCSSLPAGEGTKVGIVSKEGEMVENLLEVGVNAGESRLNFFVVGDDVRSFKEVVVVLVVVVLLFERLLENSFEFNKPNLSVFGLSNDDDVVIGVEWPVTLFNSFEDDNINEVEAPVDTEPELPIVPLLGVVTVAVVVDVVVASG